MSRYTKGSALITVIKSKCHEGSRSLPLSSLDPASRRTRDADIMSGSHKASPGGFQNGGFLSPGASAELSFVTWPRGHIPVQREEHSIRLWRIVSHAAHVRHWTQLWERKESQRQTKIKSKMEAFVGRGLMWDSIASKNCELWYIPFWCWQNCLNKN